MRRARLAFAGVLLAAAMAGAAVTVAYGLDTGFDRSARQADLPDVLVKTATEGRGEVDDVVKALPNVADRAYRFEVNDVGLTADGGFSEKGAVAFVEDGRRGYAIVAGRDLSDRPGEVVVDRGVANQWKIKPGQIMTVGRLGEMTVVGIALSPDNVAFPLATAPRVYVAQKPLVNEGERFPINRALIWAHDPANVDVMLQQARATSTQIRGVQFATQDGVRVLIDNAAGIVIALLVAFSLIALGAATTMLAATAAADVQRRLPAIGVQRAVGFQRGRIAREHAGRAARTGLVAGAIGLAAGALVVHAPATRLLEALNEQPPGWVVVWPLLGALALIVAVVAAAAAWPAWRATGRPTVSLLRGAELRATGARRRLPLGGSFAALGARLALARRGRAGATVAVLAASGAVVLLMLGLASLVTALRDDPGSVGKRYALSASLPPEDVGAVRAIPGVAAASVRYVDRGADSFALGEAVKLLAFPGDHTTFEDPPLASGRRLRSDAEAEIGVGLAQALGIGPGAILAVQLPAGEARFRIVGTVRALDNDGRVAYVRPPRLLAASPNAAPEIVVRLRSPSDKARVAQGLRDLGATASPVGGATTRDGAFLGTLAALLRAVAVIDGLVCLYALVQALGLVARERRPTISLLRATGAERGAVTTLLVGAALAVTLPAAVLALALEHYVLAPLVTRLAAGYADVSATAPLGQALLVLAGLCALAVVAAAWVARRSVREAPVGGLREE